MPAGLHFVLKYFPSLLLYISLSATLVYNESIYSHAMRNLRV